MECPKCKLKKRKAEMQLRKEWKSAKLYKCPYPDCGHLTLIQNSGTKRQDWDRDDIH